MRDRIVKNDWNAMPFRASKNPGIEIDIGPNHSGVQTSCTGKDVEEPHAGVDAEGFRLEKKSRQKNEKGNPAKRPFCDFVPDGGAKVSGPVYGKSASNESTALFDVPESVPDGQENVILSVRRWWRKRK